MKPRQMRLFEPEPRLPPISLVLVYGITNKRVREQMQESKELLEKLRRWGHDR